MKMIKITTGNQISVHDFPDGSISEQTKLLCKYIGPECELVEHVMPKRLYTELNAPRKRGNCVSMLVDEDGYYHELSPNIVDSWKHIDCRRTMDKRRNFFLRINRRAVLPALSTA